MVHYLGWPPHFHRYRAVHAGRNRPVHPMAVPFSGGTGRSHCAIPSFGGLILWWCYRGADHAAQRCGAQAMNSMNSTFAAVNNEMNPIRHRRKPRCDRGPGSLVSWGVAGPSGPNFRPQRSHHRRPHRVQRHPGRRADPELCGWNSADGTRPVRGVGGARASAHRWLAPRRCGSGHEHRNRLDQRGGSPALEYSTTAIPRS